MMKTQRSNAPSFFLILWSFMKLTPVSFGGGYSIFPAMEREIVDKRQWMDQSTLLNLLSLAAAAPGGVAINAALLIGHRLNKTSGLIAAAIGAVLPPFLLVLSIFLLYSTYGSSPKLNAAITGITWGVMSLILFSAIRMARKALKDKSTVVLFILGLISLLAGLPPLYLIIIGIIIGSAYAIVSHKRQHEAAPVTTKEDPSYMYFI